MCCISVAVSSTASASDGTAGASPGAEPLSPVAQAASRARAGSREKRDMMDREKVENQVITEAFESTDFCEVAYPVKPGRLTGLGAFACRVVADPSGRCVTRCRSFFC